MTEQIDQAMRLEAIGQHRSSRREWFRTLAVAATAAGGVGLAFSPNAANAQTGPSDGDILNFALNLEYLEAQFYLFAATGEGLPASLLGGAGTPGAATGGRRVTFTTPPSLPMPARSRR